MSACDQINVRILKRQGNEGGAAAAAGGGGDHRHWVEQQLAQLDAADSTMTDGPVRLVVMEGSLCMCVCLFVSVCIWLCVWPLC